MEGGNLKLMLTQFGYLYLLWGRCIPDESRSSMESAESGTEHPWHECMQREHMKAKAVTHQEADRKRKLSLVQGIQIASQHTRTFVRDERLTKREFYEKKSVRLGSAIASPGEGATPVEEASG